MAKAKPKKRLEGHGARSAKPTRPAESPEPPPSSLEDLLEGQARLDRQLVELLNERAKTMVEIARARKQAGQAPFVFAEEEERISRAVAANPGPLPNEAIRAALREAAGGCRSLVRELRVAFLGPLYTYSHLAAISYFGQSVELAPVGSIAAVFEEVNRGQSDFGLVPIENSTDGRITDTLDMFTRLPLKICGEVELDIHHFLLGKCARDEVHEVYSKQQPLSQCRNWLARHLPAARPIEVTARRRPPSWPWKKPESGRDCQPSGRDALRSGRDCRANRGPPEQHNQVCRHRRSCFRPDRKRSHGDPVPDGAPLRRFGGRARRLQAK
jgi:chorismate mutase/prephenate dehydratase